MLDHETRTAILRLREAGHGNRAIARTLRVSRNTVKKVLASGTAEVPALTRSEKAEPGADQIRELLVRCEGNLVRVHEELQAAGHDVAYSTLTGFCRRHGLGSHAPRPPAGQYHFGPGEEMQHDTSQHDTVIGGRPRKVHTASLVLCYSTVGFSRASWEWNRFETKVFLTEALRYLDGAAGRCMLDNSSVIMLGGTGKDAVAAPEMEVFGQRFGFEFVAHEVGDADRSAHVERSFWTLERNFYVGRTFTDLDDLNLQLLQWWDRRNDKFKRSIRAAPRELYVAEKPTLKPLPLHVPEIYEPHSRIVDVEGFVNLHTNRYTVPPLLVGRTVEAREYKDEVHVYMGPRRLAVHPRLEGGTHQYSRLEEHTEAARRMRVHKKRQEPIPEERKLRAVGPVFDQFVSALRKRDRGRAVRPIRKLHRLWMEYPDEAVHDALEEALRYGLVDLARIERMILRRIAGEFFSLRPCFGGPDDE